MSPYDVRNYLEKIYKLPVVEVNTTIQSGRILPDVEGKDKVKEPDFRLCFVTLEKGVTFKHPGEDLFTGGKEDTASDSDLKRIADQIKSQKVEIQRSTWTRSILPSWFNWWLHSLSPSSSPSLTTHASRGREHLYLNSSRSNKSHIILQGKRSASVDEKINSTTPVWIWFELRSRASSPTTNGGKAIQFISSLSLSAFYVTAFCFLHPSPGWAWIDCFFFIPCDWFIRKQLDYRFKRLLLYPLLPSLCIALSLSLSLTVILFLLIHVCTCEINMSLTANWLFARWKPSTTLVSTSRVLLCVGVMRSLLSGSIQENISLSLSVPPSLPLALINWWEAL